ncbi:hypothetical protein V1498_09945 [Peribacillus sp. SCS-26]|uniref:hypothetical protein n=1 Tax=Paraperibacillus marinus TaxID=3115295 RepID=UPI0039059DB9
MDKKLIKVLCYLYVFFMAFLAVIYYVNGETFKASVAAAGILCGAIPLLLPLIHISFNGPLTICYILFLTASQYLGSVRGWYHLGWWDSFLHGLSGILLGFMGIALYERLVQRDAGKHISPWFVFLFTFSFAVFGGVLWEVYEFTSDQLFGMTLQGGGNKDTMTDLITDSLGGLAAGTWAGIRSRR